MSKDSFSGKCPGCGSEMHIHNLHCPACELELHGEVQLPRLARLSAADREFIELFVLAAGSLKEVGRVLNLSYPTVRTRLDRVIENLRELERQKRDERLAIIQRLESGELTAGRAAELLARL